MSLLDVSGLTIRYGDETVVDGIDLYIERGESVGLVGESGSGKSQSAMAVLGLLPRGAEVTGSIEFDGQQLVGQPEQVLDTIRARRIGIVFQDPMQALNPYLRVADQLRQVLLCHGLSDKREADARVIEMLSRVGLPDPERQFHAFPHQLSGGMRQRVMIASALIAEPELLIADEPTTALDVTVQAQILDLLEEIRDNTALLLITHDLGIVAGHCEHMIVLEKGRVVDAGHTTSVFAAPRHEHTRTLLAAAPRVDRGEPPTPVTTNSLLSVGNVSVDYDDMRAVSDVSFAVKTGETVAVVGESGSGKSSLVRAVLGLVPLAAARGAGSNAGAGAAPGPAAGLPGPDERTEPADARADDRGGTAHCSRTRQHGGAAASARRCGPGKGRPRQTLPAALPPPAVGRSGSARGDCPRPGAGAEGARL